MNVLKPGRPIDWVGGLDGIVLMIDQTRLPNKEVVLECRTSEDVWRAIKQLSVRGAPAIGVAGAMGLVLGVRDASGDREAFLAKLKEQGDYLAGCRPTAVNLGWAVTRMLNKVDDHPEMSPDQLKLLLLDEAMRIREEDATMCRAIGEAGEHLIPDGGAVLTHCNTGYLATAEYGTALAVMYRAHEKGRKFKVYADETRPLLQGARLTAWELQKVGIDVTVICDNAAGMLMKQGKVDLVITGADRIAANGDAANKIGTYSLAVLAQVHDLPFYVAAPVSTFDMTMPTGDRIPIEERDPDEIRMGFGKLTAPADVNCYNPAFDVTPSRLIKGLITNNGLIQPVTTDNIRATIS